MRKSIRNITLATLLFSTINANAVSNRGFRSDMSFLDFEDITENFHKKSNQSVHIIKNEDCPVQITKAEVKDKGTVFFTGLVGAQDTYTLNVKNTSGKNILAYEVTWVLKHPFDDYVFHKIHANSISPLKASGKQKLKFRRSKHFRDDAYYYVAISKVEFEDDENVWEAPDIEKYKRVGPMDKVKEEIDAMEDSQDLSNPDSIDLEELKKNIEKLESEPLQIDDSGVKNKVELQEIKEETVPQPVEQIKQEAEKIVPVEEVKTTTTTTTTTETKIEAQSAIKETEIVKEAPIVKEADVIKETEVMKETQVLNKNQSSEDEEDFDYEEEDFDFDEDEEFDFDEDEEEEF